MSTVQLFLQYEGCRTIHLIEIDGESRVREILVAAASAGLQEILAVEALVFGLELEEPFDPECVLVAAGLGDNHRVHVHRCRKVEVTLHFNDLTEKLHFPPSATVARVKRQFVEKIHMSPVDTTEHALQICGTTDRPEPDHHIGSLVSGTCSLCFNLVPIKRIEG